MWHCLFRHDSAWRPSGPRCSGWAASGAAQLRSTWSTCDSGHSSWPSSHQKRLFFLCYLFYSRILYQVYFFYEHKHNIMLLGSFRRIFKNKKLRLRRIWKAEKNIYKPAEESFKIDSIDLAGCIWKCCWFWCCWLKFDRFSMESSSSMWLWCGRLRAEVVEWWLCPALFILFACCCCCCWYWLAGWLLFKGVRDVETLRERRPFSMKAKRINYQKCNASIVSLKLLY